MPQKKKQCSTNQLAAEEKKMNFLNVTCEETYTKV